jgi:hypothetical protein
MGATGAAVAAAYYLNGNEEVLYEKDGFRVSVGKKEVKDVAVNVSENLQFTGGKEGSQISSLAATLKMDESTLEALINEKPLKKIFHNKEIKKNVYLNGAIVPLDRISVKVENGSIILQGRFMTKDLSVKYKPWYGQTTARISKVNLKVTIRIRPRVTSQWRLISDQTKIVVESSGAEVRWGFLTFGVDTLLKKTLKKRIEKRIAKGYDLSLKMQKNWQRLYRAYRIRAKHDKTLLWLTSAPREVFVSSIGYRKGTLVIHLMLRTYLEISSDHNNRYGSVSLPVLGTLSGRQKTELYVPVRLRYAHIEKYINARIGRWKNDLLKVIHISLVPKDKRRLMIGVEYVSGGYHGRFYLSGKIVLDRKNNCLWITDVDLTERTKQALGRSDVNGSELFSFAKGIEAKLSYDLKRLSKFEKAYDKILKGEIGMHAELDRLRLDDVYLTPESIVVVAKAKGGLIFKKGEEK